MPVQVGPTMNIPCGRHRGSVRRRPWAVWQCECEGFFVARVDVPPQGCGCQTRSRQSKAARGREPNRRTHGKFGTKVYRVWDAMIQRCTNPNDQAWDYYGGRGILVCDRWLTFENFYADMGEPNGLTIERKNTNGNYESDNCKWATTHEQTRNKRNNVRTTIDGRDLVAQDWAKEPGAKPRKQIARRIKAGMSGREAVFG